ncbi:hypothetical protein DMENIID0001_153350 [Sergentomyia squamirostris]
MFILGITSSTIKPIPLTKDVYSSGYRQPNSKLCSKVNHDLLALMMVTSAPGNFVDRQSVRDTWGTLVNRSDIVLGFVIGVTFNENYEEDLENENKIYGDLIRSNSVDSYKNLTLKSLSILEWASTYCRNAKFLIKTDDDIFINIRRVLKFMENHNNSSRMIFGDVAVEWTPERNERSKWHLPKHSFESDILPNFTRGAIYVITRDIIDDLYITALETPFLWLEDVFVTGVVAEKLGISHKKIGTVVLNNKFLFKYHCKLKEITAIYEVEALDKIDYWRVLENSDKKLSHTRWWRILGVCDVTQTTRTSGHPVLPW